MQRRIPCNVALCFNNVNVLFMHQSSASSKHSELHGIVSFVVSIVLTFVQIKYQSENLFSTQHRTMVIVMSSLFIYSLAFGVLIRIDTTSAERIGAAEYKWCCIAILVFGSVSVAALLSLLIPHSKHMCYLLWVAQLLLVLGLFRKLALQLLTKILSPLSMRRSRLLPVTASDVSSPAFPLGYQYFHNQPPPVFNLEYHYWNDRRFFTFL